MRASRIVVDNNRFLSAVNLGAWSQGEANAHNLFARKISSWAEQKCYTPFHLAHSTTVAGLTTIQGGDDRFFNNMFSGSGGLSGYGALAFCCKHARRPAFRNCIGSAFCQNRQLGAGKS